jgi:flagellar biosynthesis protein FlhF
MSPAMFEVFSELLDGGVDPLLARELVSEAGESCTAAEALDPWLIRGRLSQLVGAKLSVSGPIEISDGKQQVVALVGPTGVGKTTTLAKIAAGFRFDLGCQVGLITLDTFRLGAVDQLLQYAELISAPLEVVSSPDQVSSALQRLQQCDLILLDTAGRSPRDAEQLTVLRDFMSCAKPNSTHLVLSATSSVAHAEEALKQFSLLQPTSLLVTKLDEVAGLGSWLSFLRQAALPISYLTTGQHVPQDIVVASTRRLASLLLTSGQQQGQAV